MEMRQVADGLQFPEGPVVMADGSVVITEIQGRRITRIDPSTGDKEVVADTGGGPNGLALGPDGALYVANNGSAFSYDDSTGINIPSQHDIEHEGGSIQRVDLDTGEVTTLYTECDGRPLIAPNDLVFDAHGGMYVTDHGIRGHRRADRTGLYYAKADGSGIAEVLDELDSPNGVGLSPDGATVYVAETFTGRLWAWPVSGPGQVERPVPLMPHGGQLIAGLPDLQLFDSLAVDAEGNVCVATLVNGGITSISPDGSVREHFAFPDIIVTNIAFGGDDLQTAYVTCSGMGLLYEARWPRPGLRLQHQA